MAEIDIKPEELTLLRNNKESGYNYRERRQEEWLENYTYYRGRPEINRLTQRQSVHLPLMKQHIRTLLKDVDDMPVLYFENLDNNKNAEVFQNEYWNVTVEQNKMEIKDIVDKRQVFLFGRSFDQWQIVDGKILMSVVDPQDVLVDRYVDPVDLHSSRFLIHQHIFKPLSSLEKEGYNSDSIRQLKTWFSSQEGIVKASDNQKALVEKNKKMADLGLEDVDDPMLGETYVELCMHFVYRKEEGDDEEQLYLYVEAEDLVILKKVRLEEQIGETKDHYWRNHFPYNSWADDVERQDFWSDGAADIIRPGQKVLDVWFSQLVENRTLRNFGMQFYDSSVGDGSFKPGSFNPIPWGWYGVPGNPNDIVKKVDVPDLSESLDEITFVINMLEKATGATATQQGVQTDRQVTLGEIQLMLGEAKERIQGMSKFYTPAWEARGEMFLKLIEAAPDKLDAVKIYKKGRNTSTIFGREISPSNWMTSAGYQTRVWSKEERNAKGVDDLQKLNAIKTLIPGNPKLDEIYKRKLLEFANLTPEETNDVMQFEQERQDQMMVPTGGETVAQPALTQQPAPVQMQ